MMFPLTIHNKILKFSLDFVFYFLKIPEVTPNVFQWEMAFKKGGSPIRHLGPKIQYVQLHDTIKNSRC